MGQCEGVCLYTLFQCLISVHKLTPASYGAVLIGIGHPYRNWRVSETDISQGNDLYCYSSVSIQRLFQLLIPLSTSILYQFLPIYYSQDTQICVSILFPIFKGNNLQIPCSTPAAFTTKLLKSCLHNFCTS